MPPKKFPPQNRVDAVSLSRVADSVQQRLSDETKEGNLISSGLIQTIDRGTTDGGTTALLTD